MRFGNSGRALAGVLAGATAALMFSCMPVSAADSQAQASEAGVPAVWVPKELRFVYMGFTSHYSCDGLRDKLRVVLKKLGARKDMELTQSPCSNPGGPTTFPGVYLKINVLQPAELTGGAQVVAANWRSVDVNRLSGTSDPLQDAGDCELIEQIKHQILPLFTTRNVQFNSGCIPHQLSLGATTLKAEVLVTDQSSPKVATR